MNTPAKDWKALRTKLKKLGCEFEETNGRHAHVVFDGRRVAMVQHTASSGASYRNTIARLRRAGINI